MSRSGDRESVKMVESAAVLSDSVRVAGGEPTEGGDRWTGCAQEDIKF